jgi:hypothetical protein
MDAINALREDLAPFGPPEAGLPSADFASGEVVATPQGKTPYCAIFRVERQVLFEWPVNSISEGRARIQDALRFLHAKIIELDGLGVQTAH